MTYSSHDPRSAIMLCPRKNLVGRQEKCWYVIILQSCASFLACIILRKCKWTERETTNPQSFSWFVHGSLGEPKNPLENTQPPSLG